MSLSELFQMTANDNDCEVEAFKRIPDLIGPASHYRFLDQLCNDLTTGGLLTPGPYPVDHGSTHVREVLTILISLIPADVRKGFDKRNFLELFAAAVIHDVGMIRMTATGAGAGGEEPRRQHADKEVIKRYIEPLPSWSTINALSRNNILEIASAHSGRDKMDVQNKLMALANRRDRMHLYPCAELLRIADFLNIGRSRIISILSRAGDPAQILKDWYKDYPEQYPHYFKHSILHVTLKKNDSQFIVTKVDDYELDNFKKIARAIGHTGENDEKMYWEALYRHTYDDIEKVAMKIQDFIIRLSCTDTETKSWTTIGTDDSKRERLYPLSSKIGLFAKTLEDSLPATQWDRIRDFKIDLKGHSLLGTFITAEEKGLKALIKKGAEDGSVHLRILLLDPFFETQQKFEVFQKQLEERAGRYILPYFQYGEDGRQLRENDEERGDILRVYREINAWEPKRGGSIEMRFTNRLMYVNINRFEDHLIISHYGRSGFFKGSMAIVARNENALFQPYLEEFEDIWNDVEATRLAIHKGDSPDTGSPDQMIAWIAREALHEPETPSTSPFDYELQFLKDVGKIDLLKRIFKDDKTVSLLPSEMEIQPSAECSCNCAHCIGAHLDCRTAQKQKILPFEQWQKIQGNIWESDSCGNSIGKIRISGMCGEPLERDSRDICWNIIDRAKDRGSRVVLFTNGCALKEDSVVDELRKLSDGDNIHISLDAGDQKHFKLMKYPHATGSNHEDCFDRIINGIRRLSLAKRPYQVRLGYVVTTQNGSAVQIKNFIRLADNLGVDGIRFKPDINLRRSLPSRNWAAARQTIEEEAAYLQQHGRKLEIRLTDIPWHREPVMIDRCWAQYFCAAVGHDGWLYRCDHLTGTYEGRFPDADLSRGISFPDMWKHLWEDNRLGQFCNGCTICPPYNARLNRLIANLKCLYDGHKDELWNWINKWRESRYESP